MQRAAVTVITLLLFATSAVAAEAPTDSAADPAASLEAAELAFAASVAQRDREAFAAFLDEEAVFVGASVLRGSEAILEGWSVFFVESGPRLVWHPEIVEVRADGLGLSRGPYTLTVTAPDGSDSSSSGLFTSIWRRQPDGSWKILFDAGCPPSAATTADAEPERRGSAASPDGWCGRAAPSLDSKGPAKPRRPPGRTDVD